MNKSILRVTRLSVFIAIMLLMYFTPLGLIRIPPINLTLYCIPVLTGVLFLGLQDGLILGLCFGLLSTLGAFTSPSASVALLMSAKPYSPFLVIVMSIVPRLLIPTVAYFVQKALARKDKISLVVSAAAGSLTNTVFYLGSMVCFFLLCGLDNSAILAGIFSITGLGACCEAILNAVVVPPIVLTLRHAGKKFVGR